MDGWLGVDSYVTCLLLLFSFDVRYDMGKESSLALALLRYQSSSLFISSWKIRNRACI